MGNSKSWPSDSICVGFSGGVDSVVLLDKLVEERPGAVTAVHVHHGLSPNAGAWADFCRDFCAARDVPLTIEGVNVDRNAPEGIEAAARKLRYAIYAARPEPVVALAHHLDDQAETVLLQLLRGTGLKGIAAMPELRALPGARVQLYRPLLGVSRAEIAARAKERGLKWIEDESNAGTKHDRNYLRHEVAPLLDARFPGWRIAVARFAGHAASAQGILEEVARDDGPDAESLRSWYGPGRAMYLHRQLSDERRHNALREFLGRHELPMPNAAMLAEMARQLYDARDDATVRFDHGGATLERNRGWLHVEARIDNEPWRVDWHGERELDLGEGHGSVCFREVPGEGLDPARVTHGAWYFASRSGGETIRFERHGARRTLKNVLQEIGLTLSQRRARPCLFHEGRLVWMAGVGMEVEYRVPEGSTGLSPAWMYGVGTPPVLK